MASKKPVDPKSKYQTELASRTHAITTVDPLYYTLTSLLNDNTTLYRVDIRMLHSETYMILKYPFANRSEVLARALCFSIGISIPDLNRITGMQINGVYEISFAIDDLDFKRLTLTQAEIVKKAFDYMFPADAPETWPSHDSFREKPPVDLFDPLKTYALPTLHAWIAMHIFADLQKPGEAELEFLLKQGWTPTPPKYCFELVQTPSLAALEENASAVETMVFAEIIKGKTDKTDNAINKILKLLQSEGLETISREYFIELTGCTFAVGLAVAKLFKENLRTESRRLLAIEDHELAKIRSAHGNRTLCFKMHRLKATTSSVDPEIIIDVGCGDSHDSMKEILYRFQWYKKDGLMKMSWGAVRTKQNIFVEHTSKNLAGKSLQLITPQTVMKLLKKSKVVKIT